MFDIHVGIFWGKRKLKYKSGGKERKPNIKVIKNHAIFPQPYIILHCNKSVRHAAISKKKQLKHAISSLLLP